MELNHLSKKYRGIDAIDSMDIDYADELGYAIKHIASAKPKDKN